MVKGMFLQLVEVGHSLIEEMPYQAGSSAQRIRIGLTGLAFAFLLVLLGSIITRSSRDEATNAAQQATANEPSEPLAELGVAPGSSETTNNTTTQKK
jgi:hypothetical protein